MSYRPIDFSLVGKVSSHGRKHLDQVWLKAVERVDSDPAGALTAARTFLEAAAKYVLDTTEVAYGPNLDLPQLFRLVSQELGITASADSSRIEQQFYSGIYRVVQSVSELRNVAGDAHGGGVQRTRPSAAQAELAVNLAGATAAFLLRRLDSHLAATRRLTSTGIAVMRFDKSTVWRIVDHAQNSPEHLLAGSQRKRRPCIWLVADGGIYLMSNGKPALLASGRLAKEGGKTLRRLVAHAEGCSLLDDMDDWHPMQVAMSGGDDFCEPLPIRDVRIALEGSNHQIVVVSNAEHYRIFSDVEFDAFEGEISLE